MADEYAYPEETVPVTPSRFEKLPKVFVIFALVCLGGQLFWLLGVSPFKPLSRIDISGLDGINREEFLARAGISSYTSYFSADASAIEKAILGISSVESVKVFKRFPSRLQIILENRRAVASVLTSFGGRTVPVMFDSQGVIFAVGGSESSIYSALPVISGLDIENPLPGMKLPSLFIPFFKELEKIEISAPELLEAVSEFRINRKLFDSYDLILYPVHKKVKVRLSELNEELLRYTLLMVDVLALNENGIDSFDFRSGIASYIPKEASSE